MIWGTAGRQHTWLAVGARSFALLSLVMPLILTNNQLLLVALLAVGAIWAAVTAGELLGIPGTLLLVLEAALVGAVAGLTSHSTTAVLGAMAVPPFTAGLSRGLRGVALSLSAELTTYVVIALSAPGRSPGHRGVHLGHDRPGARADRRPSSAVPSSRPLTRSALPRRAGPDPGADHLSGRLSSGLDPVALAGQIASAVRDELPVAAAAPFTSRGARY